MGSNNSNPAHLKEAFLQAKRAETGEYLASCALADLDDYLTSALTQVLIADVKLLGEDEARYHIARSGEILQRGRELTQQILTSLPPQKTSIGWLDLNGIIRTAARNYLTWAPDGIELELNLSPGLPSVHGDRRQWENLLLCLLVNATLLARDTHHTLRIVTFPESIAVDGEQSVLGSPDPFLELAAEQEDESIRGHPDSPGGAQPDGLVSFRISLTQHAVRHQHGVLSLAQEAGGKLQMAIRLPALDPALDDVFAVPSANEPVGVLLAFDLISSDSTQLT